MNCTQKYFVDNYVYSVVQPIVLSLMLIIILCFNLLACISTYTTKTTCKCEISRILTGSYLGNIMAGFSLFAGDINLNYEGEYMIGCNVARDRHFFFYMGITINLALLTVNTYIRYSFVKSIRVPVSSLRVLIKFILPAWIVAVLVATVTLIVQLYTGENFLFASLVITIPPLFFIICCNFQLTRVLEKKKRESKKTNHTPSERNVKRAKHIVERIAYIQTLYLFGWVIVTALISVYEDNQNVFIGALWVLRLMYFLTFNVEANVFIHKMPIVRKNIRQALYKVFCCPNKLVDIKKSPVSSPGVSKNETDEQINHVSTSVVFSQQKH